MKVQLENIHSQNKRSFTLMFDPKLSDVFFWHFHPEYELVYIEAESGSRHVGDHISTFKNHDLVLIGSNIPHLNFDYGIKTSYRKVVVHFQKRFIEDHINELTELIDIKNLFEKSQHGLSFQGNLIKELGQKLFLLQNLNPLNQYLSLIEILNDLTKYPQIEWLHDQPVLHKYSHKEQDRLRSIYAFVDQYYERKISLSEIAEISNMSIEAFCRYFKKTTHQTFTQFLNSYRISQSKRHLIAGKSIGNACYASGFESLSYYHRVFKKITKESPSNFKKRHVNPH